MIGYISPQALLSFPLLAALLLLAPGEGGARAATAPAEETIDRFITDQMSAGRVPGLALGMTSGDRVVYVKGYGTAGAARAVTPRTQFYLASVSKSFTALAVMQLVEAGRVSLDAPVQTYLPRFSLADPDVAERITTRQLLNQVSGLADTGFDEHRRPAPDTIAEQVARLHSARPVAPPGQEFHYFNPNYAVLARVVEVVSGQPFGEYLAQHVFTPLRMEQTLSVVTSTEAEARAKRLADGHLEAFGFAFPYPEMSGYLGGSGGVISTAEDMAHYLIAHNNGGSFEGRQLLSPEGIALMQSAPDGEMGYAMGWQRTSIDGRQVVQHNGIISTFSADIVLVPETGEGVVILYDVNSLATTTLALPRIRRGLLMLLSGAEPATDEGLTVGGWGLLMGGLTVVGGALALRSLLRLPRWASWASSAPLWRVAPGVVLTFVPALALAGLPWVVATTSGRVFSFEQLVRSMLGIYAWLGLCGALGVVNGVARIGLLARARAGRRRLGS